jgi:hypothetical protein
MMMMHGRRGSRGLRWVRTIAANSLSTRPDEWDLAVKRAGAVAPGMTHLWRPMLHVDT